MYSALYSVLTQSGYKPPTTLTVLGTGPGTSRRSWAGGLVATAFRAPAEAVAHIARPGLRRSPWPSSVVPGQPVSVLCGGPSPVQKQAPCQSPHRVSGLTSHISREKLTNGVSPPPQGSRCSTSTHSGSPASADRKQQSGTCCADQ